jgi:hypothetical protein
MIRRYTYGVHYVDKIHRCHRSAFHIVTHVQAVMSRCEQDPHKDMTNGGRTSLEGSWNSLRSGKAWVILLLGHFMHLHFPIVKWRAR